MSPWLHAHSWILPHRALAEGPVRPPRKWRPARKVRAADDVQGQRIPGWAAAVPERCSSLFSRYEDALCADRAHPIPGTDELLVITSPGSGSSTKIYRLKDDPRVKSWDLWFESTDVVTRWRFIPNGPRTASSTSARTDGPRVSSAGFQEQGQECRITRYTMQTTTPYAIRLSEKDDRRRNNRRRQEGAGRGVRGTTECSTSPSATARPDLMADIVGQDMICCARNCCASMDHPGARLRHPRGNLSDDAWAPSRDLGRLLAAKSLADVRRPKDGHVWVGQNGQDCGAGVINKKGEKLRLGVMEGEPSVQPETQVSLALPVKPTRRASYSGGRDLDGACVLRQEAPEPVGHYIYGDYSTGKIWAVKHDGFVDPHRRSSDQQFPLSTFW